MKIRPGQPLPARPGGSSDVEWWAGSSNFTTQIQQTEVFDFCNCLGRGCVVLSWSLGVVVLFLQSNTTRQALASRYHPDWITTHLCPFSNQHCSVYLFLLVLTRLWPGPVKGKKVTQPQVYTKMLFNSDPTSERLHLGHWQLEHSHNWDIGE